MDMKKNCKKRSYIDVDQAMARGGVRREKKSTESTRCREREINYALVSVLDEVGNLLKLLPKKHSFRVSCEAFQRLAKYQLEKCR